jgi:RNA polymerase primary sigma factor
MRTTGALSITRSTSEKEDDLKLNLYQMNKLELLELVRCGDLAVLGEREKRVLEFRTGLRDGARTLEEIGSKFGLSRERVRQIQNEAIRKLLAK